MSKIKITAAVTLCSLALTHLAPAWAQTQADDAEAPRMPPPAQTAPARAPGVPVYTPPPGYLPYPVLPPPPPLRYELKPRYGLVAAGAAVFGGVYLTTVLFTSTFDNMGSCSSPYNSCNHHWPLYIPVVGPFADIPNMPREGISVLVFNGLAQVAGLSMLIAGATTKKRVAVAGQITPMFSGNTVGVMGRF